MNISLSSVLPISDPEHYKVHLACWNGSDQPLDVFVQDRSEWERWNTWRNGRNRFNRRYILSLMDFYHERNTWLFGGIFEVLERSPANYSHSYVVRLLDFGKEYIGRLKIGFQRHGRAQSIKLERFYSMMSVSEILQKPYSGEVFCGYENICHPFAAMEAIIRSQRPDWKAALKNVKGVYAISDSSNGKFYVGSAYGDTGVWSRWSCYIHTGHGWNDELTKLIKSHGIEYARKNFSISLLEYYPVRTDDNAIIKREGYWKDVFMSRGQYGYNKN